MEKVFEVDITSMLKESDTFDAIEFEKLVPHTMRWKEFDFVGDNGLYWVTQEPFSLDELNQFAEAFKSTGFDKAYVTVRDLSHYDFNEDFENDVLAYIDKNGSINSDGYWAVAQKWFNESENINENFGDTKDYSRQIEQYVKEYWKSLDDKKLFDAIADIEIEVETTGDEFRKPVAYNVDIATMRKGLNDRADAIGAYVADRIPSIKYEGYKDTKMFDTDFGSDTTLRFTQNQEMPDFGDHIFDSEEIKEDNSVYGTKAELFDKYPNLKNIESYESYADDDYMAADFDDDGNFKGLRLATRDENINEDENPERFGTYEAGDLVQVQDEYSGKYYGKFKVVGRLDPEISTMLYGGAVIGYELEIIEPESFAGEIARSNNYRMKPYPTENVNEDVESFWDKGFKIGDKIPTSGAGEIELLDLNQGADYILIRRESSYEPFVAAWAPDLYNGNLSWGQGHYFDSEEDAREYFNSKINESDNLEEDADAKLDDATQNEIFKIMGRIQELQAELNHTINDEIISINASIEELNKKVKYGVDEIDTDDILFNTSSVLKDLEYLIKESNWAEEDEAENESEKIDEVLEPAGPVKDNVEKAIEELAKKHYSYNELQDILDDYGLPTSYYDEAYEATSPLAPPQDDDTMYGNIQDTANYIIDKLRKDYLNESVPGLHGPDSPEIKAANAEIDKKYGSEEEWKEIYSKDAGLAKAVEDPNFKNSLIKRYKEDPEFRELIDALTGGPKEGSDLYNVLNDINEATDLETGANDHENDIIKDSISSALDYLKEIIEIIDTEDSIDKDVLLYNTQSAMEVLDSPVFNDILDQLKVIEEVIAEEGSIDNEKAYNIVTKCINELKGESEPTDIDIKGFDKGEELEKLHANESEKINEEVDVKDLPTIGDRFKNTNGAVVVIVDPTNDGKPQFNIASSEANYNNGKYECRGTDSYESLDRMLKHNMYSKVEEAELAEKVDYSKLEDEIADEILDAMATKTLDSTNYDEVEKFLEGFISKTINNYMDETGEELIWWIEPDKVTTFKVVVSRA